MPDEMMARSILAMAGFVPAIHLFARTLPPSLPS
jgi:hypothetical protein